MGTYGVNESVFTAKNIGDLFDKVWEISIALLFLYAFFYQHAFPAIDGAMVMLCGINIVFFVYHSLFIDKAIKINAATGMLLFVMSAYMTSSVFSITMRNSLYYAVRMLEYALSAVAVSLYLMKNPGRLYNLLIYMSLPAVMLAIYALVNGEEMSTGAIGLEVLNVNSMSSLFLMVFFCSFIIFGSEKKPIVKILFIVADIVVFIAQINSASRRGFLVIIAFVVLALMWGLIPAFSKNNVIKKILVATFIVGILIIAIQYLFSYVTNETILGERLMGKLDSGDKARAMYQRVALEQFAENPYFGIGLNGVSYYVGVYSHSLYHEVLACTGISGAIFIFPALLFHGLNLFKYSLNSRYVNHKDRYITRIIFIFWLCIIVSGRAVVMIYDFYFYLWIGVTAACIATVKADAKRKKKNLRYNM